MTYSVTSREAILETCRNLVSEKGISSLNMRAVAKACNVALGSLYYYFPSKNDLLLATIESVWDDIFHLQDIEANQLAFPDFMANCFEQIKSGMVKYPNFFTIHSISFSTKNQSQARGTMDQYFEQIKARMLEVLKEDLKVNHGAFSQEFSEEDLVEFALSNLISLLIQRQSDCRILIEVICRLIYT